MSSPLPVQNKLGVVDLLRAHLPGYLVRHRLTLKQYRVVRAIVSCRTSALGGNLHVCSHCGYSKAVYRSCGDRHCPTCQATAKNRWLEKRLTEILPVPHFHVVFTLPHLFRPLVQYNRKLFYDLLFKASSETLQSFAHNPKHLGAQLGFMGILHTWGQTLTLHPHVHYLVPAGGLSVEKNQWIDLPHRGKFLFPVVALSKVFRGKFIEGVKKAYRSGLLIEPDSVELTSKRAFELFLDQAANRKWNVYAKPPFSGPEEVLLYIGRYTHRIAISDSRIRSVSDNEITFSYKDYKSKTAQNRTMVLTAGEFISRYVEHILPHNFHKIRFFGYMANGKRQQNLTKIRRSLLHQSSLEINKDFIDCFIRSCTEKSNHCPQCGDGLMESIKEIAGSGYVYIHQWDSS